MSKLVSYYESIVNLDKVSNVAINSCSITFYRLPLSIDDSEDMTNILESFHFKDEETALEAWELLKSKLGTINLEPL